MESIEDLTEICPATPVAQWVGGKRILAKRIIERLRKIPHRTYVEPFVGMGGVFLRRPFTAQCEVINDYDREVITLFRVLQRHENALIEHLKWRISSRSEFKRLCATDPETLTDIERAARFLYIQRLTFGGKTDGTYGVQLREPARFDVQKLLPLLTEVHERLSRVVIECLPWQDVIPRYDTSNTLFYLDPPYYGAESYYRAVFKREEFAEIAAILRGIKGKFLLSLNDCPEIRRLFTNFNVEEIDVTYSLSKEGVGRKKNKELLISN